MLLTSQIEILLNPKNIKIYESKGYNIPRCWDEKHKAWVIRKGTTIIVDVKDLSKGSHVEVNVCCDYCGKVITKPYKEYLRRHDAKLGDCCHKCEGIKYKHTITERYGVSNVFELEEVRAKTIETNRCKYGCDWQQQNSEVQAKSKQTMLAKYGYEHALQVPELLEKMALTKRRNNTVPTSKPQRELGKILLELYGNCELEYPCGGCSLDCMIIVEDIPIDVEYDGWFYHTDDYRDRRRDNFVKQQGYKILRVKSNKKDEMPTKFLIQEKIEMLLHGYNYVEIQM